MYYLAASIHLVYLLSMLFIVPESLSKEEMANNRAAYAEKTKRELEKERRGGSGFWYWCWTAIRKAFFFLKPLTVFLPRKRAGTLRGSNWNLTFLMISYSFVALVMVSMIAPIHRSSLDSDPCAGKLPVQTSIWHVEFWMELTTAWVLAQCYRCATSHPTGRHLAA